MPHQESSYIILVEQIEQPVAGRLWPPFDSPFIHPVMLDVDYRVTRRGILLQIVRQPVEITLAIGGVASKTLGLDEMDILHIPGITAAGKMKVQNLFPCQLILQDRIQVVQGESTAGQVLHFPVRGGWVYIMVAETRVDGIMDRFLSFAGFIALAVEGQYLGAGLVEHIAGNGYPIDLFHCLAGYSRCGICRKSEISRQAVHGYHMIELVCFRWQVEMQICRDHKSNTPFLLLRGTG